MIWRRLLVPASSTLRDLHGILQVAMGWDGIHLFQFNIRAVDFGPWELCVASPDILLDGFGFRLNDRFSYIYDMGDYWKHEVRVEGFLDEVLKKSYPVCLGGSGACPPEGCGGAEGNLARRDEAHGYDAWRDMDILSGFVQDLLERRDANQSLGDLSLDEQHFALERISAREPYLSGRFSRKQVNGQFRDGLHQQLTRQLLI